MKEFPQIAILLSTYNGSRFLKEQIDSVLAQKDVKIKLFIRDDGSTDDTCRIIEEFADERICLLKGSNLGVGNSFMETLYQAGEDYDYYAFCDQDDVWMEEKLIRAITKLQASTTPSLYCSNQMLTDAMGAQMGLRHKKAPDTSYMQIFCNNLISGCTMVWNKELQGVLTEEKRRPSKALLKKRIHDVWVAMIASVTGEVIYDEESFILYRQHEHNVVGIKKTGIVKEWIKKLRDSSQRNGRSDLAKEVVRKYSDRIKDREILRRLTVFAGYRENKMLKKKLLRDAEIAAYSGEPPSHLKMKIRLNLF